MRALGAATVVGLLLVGCGRAEETAPSTTPAPVAPSEAVVVTSPRTTAAPTSTSAVTPTTARSMAIALAEETDPRSATSTTAARASTTRRSTTTSSSSTTTTTIPLPVPVEPPAENGFRDPELVLGRIEIPAIELDSELQEGIRIPTLDDGPGHWPGTAMPGQLGNTVIAGHRTSSGAEFRRLDELVAGDEVIMTTPHGRFVYLVESIEIVAPDALWIVDQTREHRATLFACHPPGSVSQRIVAHLRLTGT